MKEILDPFYSMWLNDIRAKILRKLPKTAQNLYDDLVFFFVNNPHLINKGYIPYNANELAEKYKMHPEAIRRNLNKLIDYHLIEEEVHRNKHKKVEEIKILTSAEIKERMKTS